jgi:hypothetical protein
LGRLSVFPLVHRLAYLRRVLASPHGYDAPRADYRVFSPASLLSTCSSTSALRRIRAFSAAQRPPSLKNAGPPPSVSSWLDYVASPSLCSLGRKTSCAGCRRARLGIRTAAGASVEFPICGRDLRR